MRPIAIEARRRLRSANKTSNAATGQSSKSCPEGVIAHPPPPLLLVDPPLVG
jgi:hypothetical protein